jgi:SAM-dependent methyltransferase
MLKYVLTAASLKAFSCCGPARRLYRGLGNLAGGRMRTKRNVPEFYFERVNRMLQLNREHGFPKNGDRLLELGTGWLHWEALTSRLFFDIEAVLFDVWDNRQMSGLKHYLSQLDSRLDRLDATPAQKSRAHSIIAAIQKAASFEEMYKLLGFTYIVEESGKLDKLPPASFDVVVSAGVFEHIYAEIVPGFVQGIAATLRPGGYSFHSINIRDHLYLYDRTASPKQYLRYSDRQWERYFQNDVQYINRIQRPEWLEFFQKAGLDLVKEEIQSEDLSGLPIAEKYQHYDQTSLGCGGLVLIHRKPPAKP